MEKVIEVVTNLFLNVDKHNWQQVQQAFGDSVVMDFTSMNGGSPATMSGKQIADAWASFLPGFDSTHHQLSGFKISLKQDSATAEYFGHADHHLGNETWVVEANYTTELEKKNDDWYIISHILHLIKQSGNTSLPKLAAEVMAKASR